MLLDVHPLGMADAIDAQLGRWLLLALASNGIVRQNLVELGVGPVVFRSGLDLVKPVEDLFTAVGHLVCADSA